MIGSLDQLIHEAAIDAISDGTEKITRDTWTASAWTTPPEPPAPAARPPPGGAMTAPSEPPRRLPVPVRLIGRETIGSFLTRLAFANSLRVPHLLALAAINRPRAPSPRPPTTPRLVRLNPRPDLCAGRTAAARAGRGDPLAGQHDARGHRPPARMRALHRREKRHHHGDHPRPSPRLPLPPASAVAARHPPPQPGRPP